VSLQQSAFSFFFCVKRKTSLQVNALLPTETFITVVKGLVSNPLPSVRRKALDLLNNKLQQNTSWKKRMVSEDRSQVHGLSFTVLMSCI
jgi:hypothetical protein